MSAPRWLTAFGLSRAPFSKGLGDAELWVPASRKRIVDRVVEACHERGHVLLTGEPGDGKAQWRQRPLLRAVRHAITSVPSRR